MTDSRSISLVVTEQNFISVQVHEDFWVIVLGYLSRCVNGTKIIFMPVSQQTHELLSAQREAVLN